MAGFLSRKNLKFAVIVILIISTWACNFVTVTSTNSKPKPTSTLKTVPTEELAEIILPTKSEIQPSISPTGTEEVAALVEEPTATTSPVKKTATRTVRPLTATSEPVIHQSTQAIIPPTATVSSGGVTVTAATGNLFVRRGPGTIYSIVGGFSKGVTTKAVGRNEKNDWLAIEIPLAKGVVGWISMGTGYTEMSANIQVLPLYPYDEAKPAYIKNCTMHDMTTRPGQWNLPAKTSQKVNPGEYVILDMSTGQSKVMEMVLKEGNIGIIKVDGDGVSHACP